MKLNDTIVAQSTPQGEGAIGIIRLSGKVSIKITNKSNDGFNNWQKSYEK